MNMKSAPIDVRQLNRVFAIMTYVRAGSGLMGSLFDGHPNILNTPDCLLMNFYEFWQQHGHLPVGEVISSFMDYHAVLFDARAESKCFGLDHLDVGEFLGFTRMGPNRDECLYVDREIFRRRITEIMGEEYPVSRRLFFQALHVAYNEALGRKVTDPIIAFSLHVAGPLGLHVRNLINDFPNAKFLLMVRHPILGLASHFRHQYLRGETNPNFAFEAMYLALYRGRPMPPESSSRWRAVRLEDLHRNPRETMQRVCDWLDLPWNDVLLKSTFNDKQWWNERNTAQISGFSNVIPAQKFEDYVTKFDRFRFNLLFAPQCEAWGYPVRPWFRSIFAKLLVLPLLLIPFKIELLTFFSLPSIKTPYKYYSEDRRPFIKRIGRVIYLTCRTIYRGRMLPLKAWLQTFRKHRHEVPLL